jgi:hypothetical protein
MRFDNCVAAKKVPGWKVSEYARCRSQVAALATATLDQDYERHVHRARCMPVVQHATAWEFVHSLLSADLR